MRLSDAIREGSKDTYQSFGQYFEMLTPDSRGRWGACALGAALTAIGDTVSRDTFDIETDLASFPEIICKIAGVCPAENCAKFGGQYEVTVGRMIVHLNDGHRWSRERIADWIDSLDAPKVLPLDEVDKEFNAVADVALLPVMVAVGAGA